MNDTGSNGLNQLGLAYCALNLCYLFIEYVCPPLSILPV